MLYCIEFSTFKNKQYIENLLSENSQYINWKYIDNSNKNIQYKNWMLFTWRNWGSYSHMIELILKTKNNGGGRGSEEC